jgi:hypothetical protein
MRAKSLIEGVLCSCCDVSFEAFKANDFWLSLLDQSRCKTMGWKSQSGTEESKRWPPDSAPTMPYL